MSNDMEKKKVTLETIKELLEKQSSEADKSKWLTLLVFIGSIIVAGIIHLLPAGDFGIIVYGIALFAYIFYLYLKTEKKSKEKKMDEEQKNIANAKSDEWNWRFATVQIFLGVFIALIIAGISLMAERFTVQEKQLFGACLIVVSLIPFLLALRTGLKR